MRPNKSLFGFWLITLLNGCGNVPSSVTYVVYPTQLAAADPQTPEYVFRQRRSILLIKVDKGQLTVTAAPWELSQEGAYSTLYSIRGNDNFKSTTQIKISYIDNTKFIDELTVTTKDNIADAISKTGELIKAVTPVAAAFVAGTTAKALEMKPTVVDPAATALNVWIKDPVNKNVCVRLRNVEIESTLTVKDYVSTKESRHTFPVPACATASLDVAIMKSDQDCSDSSIASAETISTRTTYAHHSNVFPMPLPSTGSLKMHPVCGASVTEAGNQDRFQLLTYMTSILSQAKDAQAAWKEAKAKSTAAPPK